jgi:acetolactate synthase-1/3 small subunit
VLSVLLEDDLLCLNRAIGVIRRRQLPTEAIHLGPAGTAGLLRLTMALQCDPDAVDRMASQLRKSPGVREAAVWSGEEVQPREFVMVRLRVGRDQQAALFDVLALYGGLVTAESADETVIEASGTPPMITSLIRALEPLGVLEVVRSGPLTLAPRMAPGPVAVGTPAAKAFAAITA